MDKNKEDDYFNKAILDLKKEFNNKEERLLAFLGIEIEDRLYTEAEFDRIDEEVFLFYSDEDDDVSIDEEVVYELPENVSMEDYKSLLEKLRKIHDKYNV